MRILLHFGFPKCASSALQFGVWKPASLNGLLNLFTWRQFDEKESLTKRPSSCLFNSVTIRNEYLQFENKNLNILSDESFTAPLRLRWQHFGKNIINPRLFPNLIKNQIFETFGKSVEISTLIVLRNHCDLLYSQYVEEYNLKKYKNIDLIFNDDGKTINLEGFEIYNFFEYRKILNNEFGSDNTNVLFFEQIKSHPDAFFNSIDSLSGLKTGFTKEKFKQKKWNYKEKSIRGYFTKDNEYLIPYLTIEQKNEIIKYFQSDTKLLIKKYENDIDLVNLGYRF